MKLKKYLLSAIVSCMVCSYVSAQTLPANTVVKEAAAKAKAQNKQVFLIFHASWCGWCHHLDSLLTKTSLAKTFNKHFVLTHITILEHEGAHKKDENPGGGELFVQYGGGPNTGIPYWVVLSNEGKLEANSRLKSASEDLASINGDNTGCPGTPEEIAYFKTVLEKVGHFSAKEIAEVDAVFGKK